MSEINIKELLSVLIKKWWLLVICTLVFGAAATVYTKYYITPLYQSSTTMYVGKNADERGLNTAALYVGTLVIQDYSEIAKSRQVSSEVIAELGLKNISPDALAGKITIAQKPDTRVIQITVTDANPETAMKIANKEAEVFQKKVIDIMQIENVQVIDQAILQPYPVSPDKRKNMMLGFIFGFVIGAGIAILIKLLDNTIKTPDDIKKNVDLPVIGTIPVIHIKRKGA